MTPKDCLPKAPPLPRHALDFRFGGRGDKPRTVLVYGNCQTPYLARMLSGLDDLNDDYRFVAALNHVQPGDEHALPVADEDLEDVALLLHQYEMTIDNPAWQAIEARLPRDCPVIRFPSFLLSSLWPFECAEPRERHDPAYPSWKRYPTGDLLALEIAEMGLTGPLAVTAYMDLSARKMPDMRRRLQDDTDLMRLYDAHSDVKLADYVLEHFRHEHLFWTRGHMSAPAMRELARRVADEARAVIGGCSARAELCLDAAMDFEGMGGHQLPVHPLVAEALELRWCPPGRSYQWANQEWTFFEYIERYIAYDTSW
jgi:hypothetical protein